jgi:DNA-binding SARP family transcriptional activator/tetratricopeptide (TPR) repeat protein/energy-coupling factor transporter ATP-binding protein EcfA2
VTLKIYLLGQFKLTNDEQPLDLPSRPAQSLLDRREKLAGLLWPDSTETNARNYLRQALWRIRKTLESGALKSEDFLEINKISATFLEETDCWLDVDGLLQKVDELSVEQLSDVLQHYQGELLPGFYDEWVSVERDHFQTMFHQKMGYLLGLLSNDRKWDQVLEWGEHWIRHGHAPESAFQAVMQAHADLGNPGMVQTTYERCRDSLERELGTEPSSETQHLLERLNTIKSPLPAQVDLVTDYQPVQKPAFLEQATMRDEEDLPFVAREKELSQLQAHLDGILSNQGKVVFVIGEAGSGKTTLLDKFNRQALSMKQELIVAGGNCNAHTGLGDPYLPLREILGQLTGDVETRLQAGALTLKHAQRLWNLLPATIPIILECGPDLIDTFVAGRALLNRGRSSAQSDVEWLIQLKDLVERKEGTSLLPGPQQTDLFEQYTRVLRGITQIAPTVLIIDDLQWADAGSIGLLFHIGRHLGGMPLLIIGSYRKEDVAAGREGARHPLEPLVNEFQRLYGDNVVNLGDSDRRKFLELYLDSEPNHLDQSFRDMLYQQTQGHPLFTIELLRGMQERGDLIQGDDGQWIEGSALNWVTLPARVEAVIAERIGRLPDSLQSIVRVGSVEGEIFTNEVVARVLDQDERQLLPQLSGELDKKHRLIRADSIHRLNGQVLSSYRFRNILFQKYLYSSLDHVERVHLHEQVGVVLEGLCSEVDEFPDVDLQLARHFEEAGIKEKAIHYLHLAGDRAISISACSEGIVHIRRALELLESLPETREREEKELEMQLSIGKAWKYEGPSTTARNAINRARDLCLKLDRPAQLARTLGELTILHYVMAKYDQAKQIGLEALELAEETKDPLLIVEGHWLLSVLNFCLADYVKARGHLDKVSAFYDPHEHHAVLIELRGVDAGLSAMAYDACCLQTMGYPDQALKKSQDAIALAKSFDHSFTLADVLCFAGCMVNEIRNDGESLSRAAADLKQLTDDKKLDGWIGHATRYKGAAMLMRGETEQAIQTILDGIDISNKTSELLYQSLTLCSLARAQAELDMLDDGLATIDEALDVVEKTGEKLWESELYRVQGEILVLGDDPAGAETSLHKAIELSRIQKAKSWELRATISLARLWQEQGKTKQAKKMLGEIYSWFTEGFNSPDLQAAKLLLDEL